MARIIKASIRCPQCKRPRHPVDVIFSEGSNRPCIFYRCDHCCEEEGYWGDVIGDEIHPDREDLKRRHHIAMHKTSRNR